MSRRRQTRSVASERILTLQHGPVELIPGLIADPDGRPACPYRAVDTLRLMERRGSITAGMRQAGEDFRRRFAVARFDPLRSINLSRLSRGDKPTRHNNHAPSLRAESARAAVWRAIRTVGGIAAPAGSCLWHVVGWERSLKKWAQEQGGAPGHPRDGVGYSRRHAWRAGDAFSLKLRISHICD